MPSFLVWGDFHACSRFACSTISEEKWGTTRSLLNTPLPGIFFRGDWIYFNFELDCLSWSSLHINHEEANAIMLAAKRWAPQWANHRVLIHGGNQAAVRIINKGSRENELIVEELRDLFWLSARHNFHITALHFEGLCNPVADAISRLYEPQLLSRFYTALIDYLPRRFVHNMPLCLATEIVIFCHSV